MPEPLSLPEASASHLPRWRGFNLLEKYSAPRSNGPFLEKDFQMISDLGFNFARLPMDYRIWIKNQDWKIIDETPFREIDQALEWGRKYRIHVCLNFHRAPGYCINPPKEPKNLWTDPQAQETCADHWSFFAGRYRGIPNRELSFDLFNEPDQVDNAAYARVVRIMVEAIRQKDPHRLVIADGTETGNRPVPELISLGVAQATRGYQPMEISHYRAPWVKGSELYPTPVWPMNLREKRLDREWFKKEFIDPWKHLEAQGVGVFVGEWGAYRQTPHPVLLNWMQDHLELWKEAGWGWALWNFRGDFGFLDSQRPDVVYEDFYGHKLDRKMLELLKND
ncbi:MAG TPA: cellulase family glycosylhydrolase [bacterium]|nr:cellulase family glycosylhydrolase [bacterium]